MTKQESERQPIPKSIRFEIFKRDNFTCQYCGQKAPDVVLHADHINPVSKGGTNDLLNLITSCLDCNLGKSDRTLADTTIIDRKRTQMEKLQERREQIAYQCGGSLEKLKEHACNVRNWTQWRQDIEALIESSDETESDSFNDFNEDEASDEDDLFDEDRKDEDSEEKANREAIENFIETCDSYAESNNYNKIAEMCNKYLDPNASPAKKILQDFKNWFVAVKNNRFVVDLVGLQEVFKAQLNPAWTVLDLFSGAGGMSYGFHVHPWFQIVGAVDAQIGKPSDSHSSLQCNLSYFANMGVKPIDTDLSTLDPRSLRHALQSTLGRANPTILIACPPCTGFSRTVPQNHITDDPRNSLVTRTLLFVEEFQPQIFLMENARELIRGNFKSHYHQLSQKLNALGYKVSGQIELLNRFGLPQTRERAIIIAVQNHLELRTLSDLWAGFQVRSIATHVRRAISRLPPIQAGKTHPEDPLHTAPSFAQPKSLERLKLIPKDGGSWADLKDHPQAQDILTPAMLNYIAKGQFGSHPDVYGRLWWDRPAATIKRECAHIGNGRYAHPEQDRLCTVRELSILQGFPKNYKFISSNKSNLYRQIGDAVPPLISYQLAKVCEWILSDVKPTLESAILPKTHLVIDDLDLPKVQQIELDLMSQTGNFT